MGRAYHSHAHNFIVDAMRYGGLIGALLLTVQVTFVAAKGLILVRHNSSLLPLVAWFYLGVFFLLTNGQQPLVKPHHIWFFYWLPLVLIVGKTNLHKVTPTKSS
jgi:O-antigen ligase